MPFGGPETSEPVAAHPLQIGPYRVLGLLGQGGMGYVYAGLGPGGDRVAIKVLVPGRAASPVQRQRFAREAHALASIDHPHVVRLRAAGEHEGRPYLVLDYHAEGTLQNIVAAGRKLPPELVQQVGIKLADALASVHACGVLHRDIKPENVLLSSTGEPLLTDFGLAKELTRLGQTAELTRSGAAMGTPGFWAPEQATGDPAGLIGPATDVYGLGATLYAAMTGLAPVAGETLVEILAATLSQRPVSIRDLRPEVPRWLDAVVLRCLEKDPEARWSSAAELRDALREEREPPSARRRRRAVAAGLAAGLGASLLLALWIARGRDGDAKILGSVSPGAPPSAAPSADAADLDPIGLSLRLAARSRAAGAHAEADRHLQSAAASGSAEAMCALGESRAQGLAGSADRAQAIEWYLRAARGGDPRAPVLLGTLLASAPGGMSDAEAAPWVQRAAEADVAVALNARGSMLAAGVLGEPDFPGALAAFRRAAELGDAEGMTNTAVLLYQGRGAPADLQRATELLERAVALEHPDALNMLGTLLVKAPPGSAPSAELTRGVALLERAAQAGNVPALTTLGVLYLQGHGVAPDPSKGQRLLEQAAGLGEARAMYNLSQVLIQGEGVPADPPRGFEWLKRAAEAGDPEAAYSLSRHYSDGVGLPQSELLALEWARKAAERGYVPAMATLGVVLAKSSGDEVEAKLWLERAARAGSAEAMFNLGALLARARGAARDYAAATQWFARAAAAGESRSMLALAGMYLRGEGVPRSDARAFGWYLRAAEAGDARAMGTVGELFLDGRGTPVNEGRAAHWMRAAALGGDVPGMATYGSLLRAGIGTPKDLAEGARWIRRAAEEGNAFAMGNYAQMLERGEGVAQSLAEALRWYRLAARSDEREVVEFARSAIRRLETSK